MIGMIIDYWHIWCDAVGLLLHSQSPVGGTGRTPLTSSWALTAMLPDPRLMCLKGLRDLTLNVSENLSVLTGVLVRVRVVAFQNHSCSRGERFLWFSDQISVLQSAVWNWDGFKSSLVLQHGDVHSHSGTHMFWFWNTSSRGWILHLSFGYSCAVVALVLFWYLSFSQTRHNNTFVSWLDSFRFF